MERSSLRRTRARVVSLLTILACFGAAMAIAVTVPTEWAFGRMEVLVWALLLVAPPCSVVARARARSMATSLPATVPARDLIVAWFAVAGVEFLVPAYGLLSAGRYSWYRVQKLPLLLVFAYTADAWCRWAGAAVLALGLNLRDGSPLGPPAVKPLCRMRWMLWAGVTVFWFAHYVLYQVVVPAILLHGLLPKI